MNPLLEITNLTAGIGQVDLVRNLSWTIRPGEHWIIRGKTGSGKSSLCQAITGKMHLRSGQITYPFLGENPGFDARRAAVQMVSFTDNSRLFNPVETTHYYQQRYHAFDSEGHLTVREYLQLQGLDADNPEHTKVLFSLGIDRLLNRERIKLSSGQTRKLLLVKALLHQPAVLILDNACLGLDVGSVRVLYDLLEEVVLQRPVSLVLTEPIPYIPDFITHEIHLDEGTSSKPSAERAPEYAEPDPELHQVKDYFHSTDFSNPPETMVNLEDIHVNYLDTSILKYFNWKVFPGEKWALQGPNGVGKSTLLALIYADHPQVYSNKVYLFGQRRGKGDTIWEVKKRIGFSSPELHAYFHSKASALDVILTGLEDRFQLLHPPSHEAIEMARTLLRIVGKTFLAERPFPTLSTGEQRLILFLRALIKAPEMLLLDEPYQGLDDVLIHKCNQLLESVLTDRHTLIFITHRKEEIPKNVAQQLNLAET